LPAALDPNSAGMAQRLGKLIGVGLAAVASVKNHEVLDSKSIGKALILLINIDLVTDGRRNHHKVRLSPARQFNKAVDNLRPQLSPANNDQSAFSRANRRRWNAATRARQGNGNRQNDE